MFAVGSTLSMNNMPDDMLEAFINVFSRLPQRVIWQWKGEPRSDLADNIKTVSWLPQQDLLGKRSVKLFTRSQQYRIKTVAFDRHRSLQLPLVSHSRRSQQVIPDDYLHIDT